MSTLSTRFRTESPPPATLTRQEALDLHHAAYHPTYPLLKPDGTIIYERGAACVGCTPDGEWILLTTTDEADLPKVHRFKDAQGNITDVAESDLEVKPKDRKVGLDIRGDGSVYMGQFLVQQENDFVGDTNFDHILGVAAWVPRAEQQLGSVLERFSELHRRDALQHGLLLQHDPLVWTSKDMVFFATPQTCRIGRDEVVPKTYEGNPLYQLTCLMSPRKGWDASALYDEVFAAKPETRTGRFKQSINRLLARQICITQDNMTMDGIERYIAANFSPTVKRMRRGYSPYINDNGPRKDKRGLFKHLLASAIFGLQYFSKKDLLLGVATPTFVGIAGAIATGNESYLSLLGIPVVGASARFGFLWFGRSNKNFKEQDIHDIVDHFLSPDSQRKYVPHPFGMVNKELLKDIRILSAYELDQSRVIPSNRPDNAPDGKTTYMLNPTNTTYGGVTRVHKVGERLVLTCVEDSNTSGMVVEYWGGGVAFTRNPTSKHLPLKIREAFERNANKPICMTRVRRNADGHITGHREVFLTQAQYERITDRLSKTPTPMPQAENTRSLHPDYPLPAGPKAVKQNGGGFIDGLTDSAVDVIKTVAEAIGNRVRFWPH